MTTMDVAELVGKSELQLTSRDRPRPGDDEVLVAVSRVGICGSDLHWYEHGKMGDRVVEEPLVLGHEGAGTIAATGDSVRDLSVGDRVAIEPGVPCRRCRACRNGEYNLCPDVEFMATPGTDGALAEYVAWPAEFVHPVPDTVSTTEAALCEPLSVGLQATKRGEVGVGDTVLIMGMGPIGRVALECTLAAGATEIVAVDVVDEKLDQASDHGADMTINSRTEDVVETVRDNVPDGVDVAIEATGAPPAIETIPDVVGTNGTVVLVGLASGQTIPFDTYRLIRKQIDVRGSYRFANTYSDAIGLVADGTVDLESMVDFETPLSDVSAGFERAADPDVVKGVVAVSESG